MIDISPNISVTIFICIFSLSPLADFEENAIMNLAIMSNARVMQNLTDNSIKISHPNFMAMVCLFNNFLHKIYKRKGRKKLNKRGKNNCLTNSNVCPTNSNASLAPALI